MKIVNSVSAAMAVVAAGKVRSDERVTFRLMPVPSRALPGWNRRVADWMAS